MTRVTNFGRGKRTYVEAGFDAEPSAAESSTAQAQTTSEPPVEGPPKKKKRIRTPMSKRDRNPDGTPRDKTIVPPTPPSKQSKKKKLRERKPFVSDSESRRLKRMSERQASTICFACRQVGHAARDCPASLNDPLGNDPSKPKAKAAMGICYRCGSDRHSLSHCRKTENPSNPLPYASCFVCTQKGHLASGCPKNTDKGIYPDGGSCKLCGDKTHLAKHCGLRKNDVVDDSALLGTGREAGADEDDFHTFKRKRTELDHNDKQEETFKKMMDVRTGAHSGVVKSFGAAPTAVQSKKQPVIF